MSSRRSADDLTRSSLINIGARLLAIGLGMVVTLLAAQLGPRAQGAFALFTAVEAALLTFGAGFSVVIARRISRGPDRPRALVGGAVVVVTVGGVLCSALLHVIATKRADLAFLVPLAWVAPTLFLAPTLLGIWLGLGRMPAMAVLTLSPLAVALAGIAVAFAWSGTYNVVIILWCWAIARAVVGVGSVVAAWRGGWIGWPRSAAVRVEWRFFMVVGATNFISILNYKADLFLLGHYAGLAETGIYSIAVLVAELLWLVSASVTQAAYARIGTPDSAEAQRLAVRVVRTSVVLLAMLSPLLWLIASVVIPQVLGARYAAALGPLAVLLPGVVAFGAASGLSAYFTNHAGKPQISAGLGALSLAMNVVVCLMLIPRWGMYGAAVATTVSYVGSIAVSLRLFSLQSGMPMLRLLAR